MAASAVRNVAEVPMVCATQVTGIMTGRVLRDRGTRILSTLTGLERNPARDLLDRAGGHVKLAIVMHRLSVEPPEAQRRLDAVGGNLRAAMTGAPRG